MTYQNKLVTVVKSNNAILREKDGCVKLPFGSEYSLLLKNLESRKARVKITIDGEDVLSGNSLILNGNSDMELEGFLRGSTVSNRFKFTKKTEQIVKHRGDRIDDGMIRVEFWFEKARREEVVDVVHEHYHHDHWSDWGWAYSYPHRWGSIYDCNANAGDTMRGITTNASPTTNFASASASSAPEPLPQINSDEGITVKGSQSDQVFSTGITNELEETSHVILIQLRGYTGSGVKIEKPVTVRTKLECPTCGTKSKSNAAFCALCGTSLE